MTIKHLHDWTERRPYVSALVWLVVQAVALIGIMSAFCGQVPFL